MDSTELLDHFERESARFGQCLDVAGPDAEVPTCDGWNSADLLWHLTEVQLFWVGTTSGQLADPSTWPEVMPARPADYHELAAMFSAATVELSSQLRSHSPGDETWTWSDDQSIGFVIRRQAQEALIHRVDAELTAATRSPIDPGLAADGVDEALQVMFAGVLPGATFTADGQRGRITATDTNRSWDLVFGSGGGANPSDDRAPDVHDAFEVGPAVAGIEPDVAVEGDAAELDLWLWRRSETEPKLHGHRPTFERLTRLISPGIQ